VREEGIHLLVELARSTRRRALAWAAAGAFGISRLGRAAAAEPPEGAVLQAGYRPIEAAVDRILPSREGTGAREAKVMRFIERQLASDFALLLPAMKQGALLIDRVAEAKHKKPFADLDPASQDRILGLLARGELPITGFPQKEWFSVLLTLTLEGFLSDPIHGGNADQIGWRSIGFAEPHRRLPVER
jgi:gluconate 2-dehydrogenase gamma chain